MNVYDFDGTIYDGDSTMDFYFFCLKRNPKILFCLFIQGWGLIKYILKIIKKDEFKEQFYVFLTKIDDIDKFVNDFWDLREKRIGEWYKKQQSETDIIISASPEFLLKPICKRLNINDLIASKVDDKTGKLLGFNCYGKEKVRRFKEKFLNVKIAKFYFDSLSDLPLTQLSKENYIIKKNVPTLWKNRLRR